MDCHSESVVTRASSQQWNELSNSLFLNRVVQLAKFEAEIEMSYKPNVG